MSEGTSSSESAGETAKPEPIAAPKGGNKRKLWLMIAAVVVVALLVGTSVYVMFLTPMKASMSPDEISIDAGQMMSLSVSVKKGIKSLTDSDSVKYRWRLNPDTLATFNMKSRPSVNLTAGIVEGQGTLTCEVTYKGEKIVLEKQVTVKPPFLDQIIISPGTKTLDRGMSKIFSASAVDSVGNPVLNLSYTWSVSGVTTTINATSGPSVNLTVGNDYGNATLAATASWRDVSKTGNANIIVGPLPPRKIDYVWYKMFDVPFGDWWNTRWTFYKTEKVMTNTYPYMFQYFYTPEGNVRVYANARLNITARNVTSINMNENPEFLPLHGSARGGTAVIDWYLQYLTSAEIEEAGISPGNNDGWVVGMNGTVTLDKQAAMSVIKGFSSTAFDTFSSWWSTHGTEVGNDIMVWLADEAGKDRLNINPAYDGTFQMMAGSISGAKVGDKVVLTYKTVTWGMESIIMRWLREAFMPTEYWYEDMNFHAVIGPELAKLDIDTAVAYAIYAYDTTVLPAEPCWVFEGMYQDVNPSNPPDIPHSDIDPYLYGEDGSAAWQYLNRAPGNRFYNQMMDYDTTPAAWNLSANETLTLSWPSGQLPFLVHIPPASPTDLYASTARTDDTMVVKFGEPFTSDNNELLPGSMSVSNTERKVVFTGPIDMWDWSRNQTAHGDLSANWSRIHLLPHGAPWIEFQKEHGLVSWLGSFDVTDVPDMPVNDTPMNITVTTKDNYGRAFPEFAGTVHFEANRSDIVLPADYTFNPSVDGGKKTFVDQLRFLGEGYYQINVSHVGGNATGNRTNLWVIPTPEVIDSFGLEVRGVGTSGVVLKGLRTDFQVTAYNQYPAPHNVFHEYSGTVVFETNASPGSCDLPAPTTFSPSNLGTMVLQVTFKDIGTFALNASDQANPLAKGTVSVVVSISPKIDYKLYGMFEQRWHDWWVWRGPGYGTDWILNNRPHEYTMVYNDDSAPNVQGTIQAPYRWAANARNLTTLSVHSPEFMPIIGTHGVPGASVDMKIWFEYLDNRTWNGYWVPTWGSDPGWTPAIDDLMRRQWADPDGYRIGTLYNITMNREAALEWLGMPMTDTPSVWWAANKVSYQENWTTWLMNESNNRLDIWPGYADVYWDLGTVMKLTEDTATGNVTLSIAHFNWGYEVLIVRWLSETTISPHEPYMEDFNLTAHYARDHANVSFDAVAQYSLHAVKANGTDNSSAWVWEPAKIDYNYYVSNPNRTSDWNPYTTLRYNSWNAGDGRFNRSVAYDITPRWFNLTDYMTLTIQLPLGDNVIGYVGQKLFCRAIPSPAGAIYDLKQGNASAYENITIHGPMWLGYNMTGFGPSAPNLWTYYNNNSKTLSLVGPLDFDNYRWPNGMLYHSAPWIEFNVANFTWGVITSLPVSPQPGAGEPAVQGSSLSEVAALAIVLVATSMAVVALGIGARRKD